MKCIICKHFKNSYCEMFRTFIPDDIEKDDNESCVIFLRKLRWR